MPTANQNFEYGDLDNSDILASKNIMNFYKNYNDENSKGITTQAEVIKIDMDTFENHIINIDNNLDEIIHYITSSQEKRSTGAGINKRMIGGRSSVKIFHELEGPRYYDDVVNGSAYMPNSGLYGGALFGGSLVLMPFGSDLGTDNKQVENFINKLDIGDLLNFVISNLVDYFKQPENQTLVDLVADPATDIDDARAAVIGYWQQLIANAALPPLPATPALAVEIDTDEEPEEDAKKALEDAMLPVADLGSSILTKKPTAKRLNDASEDELAEIAKEIIGDSKSENKAYSQIRFLGAKKAFLLEIWQRKYKEFKEAEGKASPGVKPPPDGYAVVGDLLKISEELKSPYYNDDRLLSLYISLKITGEKPKGKKATVAKIMAFLDGVADPIKLFNAAKHEKYEYNPILQTITKINISIDKAVSYLKSTFLRDAKNLSINQIDDLSEIMEQIVAKQEKINKAIVNSLLFDPATVNALHNMSKKLDSIVDYIYIATGNKKFDISPGDAIMQDILVEPPEVEYESAFDKLDKKLEGERKGKAERVARIAEETKAKEDRARRYKTPEERAELSRLSRLAADRAKTAIEKARKKAGPPGAEEEKEGAGLRGRRKMKGGNITVMPSKYTAAQQKIITKYLL
jgi:hypothetical protein